MFNSRSAHIGYFVLAALSLLAIFVFGDTATIHAEGGFFEDMQALFLALAAILFVVAAIRLSKQPRYAAAFFAIISFGFCIRELDAGTYGLPPIFDFLTSRVGGTLVLVLPIFFMLFLMAKSTKHYVRHLKAYVFSATGIYIALTVVLLALSWPLDRGVIRIANYVFYEELLELFAFYFWAIAALLAYGSLKKFCPNNS